jgi:hypothetical protein
MQTFSAFIAQHTLQALQYQRVTLGAIFKSTAISQLNQTLSVFHLSI